VDRPFQGLHEGRFGHVPRADAKEKGRNKAEQHETTALQLGHTLSCTSFVAQGEAE
jgi:hypothetical protein